MNGNITEDGIRKDLEWMHRVGIGGVNNIDASLTTPQVVSRRLAYMTPEWQAAFKSAVHMASSYGMEFGIDSSPGWSESGGPWVSPAEAMKKMVWSASTVEGGHEITVQLPRPPDNSGPFQNVPMAGRGLLGDSSHAPHFYRDSIALAYRAPVPRAIVGEATSSGGSVDAKVLDDGDLTGGVTLPVDGDQTAWLELKLSEPTIIQGLTLAVSTPGLPGAVSSVQSSADERTWRTIATLQTSAGDVLSRAPPEDTISFAPMRTRYVRVLFSVAKPVASVSGSAGHPAAGADTSGLTQLRDQATKQAAAFEVHELFVRTEATVNHFEQKAGFVIANDNYAIASVAPSLPNTAVSPKEVVDVSAHMGADGTLHWTPPAGRWVVLRMGYAPEGTTNHPATLEATGLEVDKLSKEHVDAYIEHYLNTYATTLGYGEQGPIGIQAMTVDSTEVGAQNWTEHLLDDFKADRGYDPTPWLPTLTGVVVGSPQQSDRFLWDFRHVIAELLAKNHYAELVRVAHQRGLTVYGEALENHRPTFGDDMQMRQYNDIPMAALWSYGDAPGPNPDYLADIEGAASVAHLYGQNLVAAESMTSGLQFWAYAPWQLKPIVDIEFATGVNRVVVHSSVHQPLDRAPGLSLAIFGQFFNRLETWAEQAGPWMRYIARCDYLLQQGRFAADVAYFYGQEAPLTGLFGDHEQSAVPPGYGFDFVDPDALQHQLTVEQGQLVSRSGMRYRILYLGGSSRYMTLDVLLRIRELVEAGAVLVGERPSASPSLRDDSRQFASVADSLFGPKPQPLGHLVGKGTVFATNSVSEALSALKLTPDFSYGGRESGIELRYLHRHLDRGELYFISNRQNHAARLTATFRVSGLTPELWDAVSGSERDSSYQQHDGSTDVPLELAPYGSVFVLFRHAASSLSRRVAAPAETPLLKLDAGWSVSYQPQRGAPVGSRPTSLGDWSANSDPAIRYFSGTATYHIRFNLPAQHGEAGSRLLLDLGLVHELAEVKLNGKRLGVVWTAPFRLDITDAATTGQNELEVAVTNLWVNRLIGDQQPGVMSRYTFTTIPTYRPDAPLRASGLLGPVSIRVQSRPGG